MDTEPVTPVQIHSETLYADELDNEIRAVDQWARKRASEYHGGQPIRQRHVSFYRSISGRNMYLVVYYV